MSVYVCVCVRGESVHRVYMCMRETILHVSVLYNFSTKVGEERPYNMKSTTHTSLRL